MRVFGFCCCVVVLDGDLVCGELDSELCLGCLLIYFGGEEVVVDFEDFVVDEVC